MILWKSDVLFPFLVKWPVAIEKSSPGHWEPGGSWGELHLRRPGWRRGSGWRLLACSTCIVRGQQRAGWGMWNVCSVRAGRAQGLHLAFLLFPGGYDLQNLFTALKTEWVPWYIIEFQNADILPETFYRLALQRDYFDPMPIKSWPSTTERTCNNHSLPFANLICFGMLSLLPLCTALS